MKPIINRLAGIAGYVFFAPYYIWRRGKARPAVVLIITVLLLSSCFQHYFRTGTAKGIDAATIQQLQNAGKYFILHSGNTATGLVNVKVSGEMLEGDIAQLPEEHRKYLNPKTDKTNRVKKHDKPITLVEVHLYRSEMIPANQTHLSIPFSSINRMDVYEFDKSATTANHILSWVGVSVITLAAAVGIIFAATCNCPQVYVNNNGQYEFKSGVYSGAIHSGMERTDYLALPGITPVNNKYQFRIGNVPNEEQFINQVQLMKVEHPADVQVLADRHGKILTYKNALSPTNATYDDGTDVTAQLKFTDGQEYLFDSKATAGGFSSVMMSWARPAGVKKGKLLVHAGNSNWSGYLFKEFVSLFGNSYEKWRLQQELKAAPNSEQWQLDQGLPLKVCVETEKGWQYVDHFALTGNTASRDMIMEIDLTGVKKDKVNIRIESAFQFWNLDMAALDFSDNAVVSSVILNPASVVKNNKEDNQNQLLQKDAAYSHLSDNDYINLEYDAPASSGNVSFFLVSTGYYHTKPPISKKTDLQALLEFKEKGAFDRFSRNKFAIIQEALAKAER
jgi:hypothetical protein